jgi:hypothetical protein
MDGKRGRGRPRKNPAISAESQNISASTSFEEPKIETEKFDFSQGSGGNGFNPLGEEPIIRDYATPKIEETQTMPLEEPSFHQKSFDEIKNAQLPPQQSQSSQGQATRQPSPLDQPMQNVNPAMNQLDDKEKRLATEQMADAILDTYDTACMIGGSVAKVKEQKVAELIADGKIDGARRIPIDEQGNTVNVLEFIQGFNEQIVDAVKPDPAFRKNVREPLVRVLSKRGMGMTDEQYIGFAVVKDLGIKTFTIIGMRKGINDILNRLQDEASGQPQPQKRNAPPSSNGFSSPSSGMNTPPPPPSPAPPPTPEFFVPEIEELTDEEIAYQERMDAAANLPQDDQDNGVNKHKITFEDNPLREKIVREYPAPHVKETFTQGGEIVDEMPTQSEGAIFEEQ